MSWGEGNLDEGLELRMALSHRVEPIFGCPLIIGQEKSHTWPGARGEVCVYFGGWGMAGLRVWGPEEQTI